LSRLEFDHDGDIEVMTRALTPRGSSIPFKMSDYSNPELASNIRVRLVDPLKTMIVKPFMVLTAQAKTTTDAVPPGRPWIHNNSTRPVSYQALKVDHQAWNSHELALSQYLNGMSTDAKVDANNRGFAFGGSNSLFGSSFCIHRELALTPVQSVAQLSHFDLAASAFPGAVDHPVGNSFAHPLVKSDAYQTQMQDQPPMAVDHSWLANSRLWDSWYASTFVNQGIYSWPIQSHLRKVVTDFVTNAKPLANSRFTPWTGSRQVGEISGLLTRSATRPQDGAYRQAAATQLLNGAFNVNSTSKAAWMAVLGGLDRETITSLLFDGSAFTLKTGGLTTTGPYLSRRRIPAESTTTSAVANARRFNFWNSGCELTGDELEALAEGIVREVKLRGPFLSLAEFVNRRLGPPSALTLKGAVQAAIDDAPGFGSLNTNSQGTRKDVFAELSRTISAQDVAPIPYAYAAAAEGNTATGASGGLDQLAVLTQIGAGISARSDTFRIRAYGEATDRSGKMTARAWCEAVIQRVPDYVLEKASGGNEPWDEPATLHPVNQAFGRHFAIHSFRWLTEKDI
jgi:hypothetical protein